MTSRRPLDSSNPQARFKENLKLATAERRLGRIHLQCLPSTLTIVLSNACNIDCGHCYQHKNGDSLLRDPQIGNELRRELLPFYPYLDTVTIQGGEVFILPGFEDLLDDIQSVVDRPIIRISTNATLIDEAWAERIVTTPFHTVTVSIDAGTDETFRRLRVGANLADIVENIRRIQRWKERLQSPYPHLDVFFVVMRSNFREIPVFLELLRELHITAVTFQLMEVDERNLSRNPGLTKEVFQDPREVQELHEILVQEIPRVRQDLSLIAFSGLTTLFQRHGLDTSVIDEEHFGIQPLQGVSVTSDTADGIAIAIEEAPAPGPDDAIDTEIVLPVEAAPCNQTCANPWTMMFIVENGDVHICFDGRPVGNLYEQPLISIWNGPKALETRSEMLAGDYIGAGCSELYCGWRQGRQWRPPVQHDARAYLDIVGKMFKRAASQSPDHTTEVPHKLGAVRRMLTARNQRIAELESDLGHLCGKFTEVQDVARSHIDHLEGRVAQQESQLEQIPESKSAIDWVFGLLRQRVRHFIDRMAGFRK